MGAWGYGPFEDDSVADFMGDAISVFERRVRHTREEIRAGTVDPFDYVEARAAIEALAALAKGGYPLVMEDVLYDSEEVLEAMLADPEFLATYYKPELLRRRIRSRLQAAGGRHRRAAQEEEAEEAAKVTRGRARREVA